MDTRTHNEKETMIAGQEFASALTGGEVVCLYGDLGAGKSTLVRGIALGLGVTDTITSPTFTLMNVYHISRNTQHLTLKTDGTAEAIRAKRYAIRELVHIDTYRLKDAQELVDIGVLDYLGQPGVVTIIEWPEKVEELLQGKNIIKITLEHGTADERTIRIVK